MALEEEAFPFEEKAIGVHEKNVELLQAGVFNAWTEKSLGKLRELMPGRYAKDEVSSGFLGAIETYAYWSPVQNQGPPQLEAETPPPGEPIRTPPLGPIAAREEKVDHEDPH